MKMGEDTIDGIHEMFSVCILWNELMFVLTLSIQELRELQGEHSGENMAEAVWETLKQYDLIRQVSLPEYCLETSSHKFPKGHCFCYGQYNKQ